MRLDRFRSGFVIASAALWVLAAGCSDDGNAQHPTSDAGTSDAPRPDAESDDASPAAELATVQVLQETSTDGLEVVAHTIDGQTVPIGDTLDQHQAAVAQLEAGPTSFSVNDAGSGQQLDTLESVELAKGASYVLAVVGVQHPERRPSWPTNPSGADIDVHLQIAQASAESDAAGTRVLHAVADAASARVGFDLEDTLDIEGLGFGQFSEPVEITPYLDTPVGLVHLQVDTGDQPIVLDAQTPEIDSTLRGTIVVYGFADEAHRNSVLTEDVRLGFYPAETAGEIQLLSSAATYRFLHLSPDAGPLEVQVDGQTIADRLDFRDATAPIVAPAGYELDVDFVGLDESTSGQTLASQSLFLQPDTIQTFIAAGLRDDSDNDHLSNIDFDLQVFTDDVQRHADIDEQQLVLWGFYATTDEFAVTFTPQGSNYRLFQDSMFFGDWKGPVERDASQDVVLDLELPSGPVGSYNLPLATEDLGGERAILVASGYLTPEGEDGRSDAPAFDLRLYLDNGTVLEVEPAI